MVVRARDERRTPLLVRSQFNATMKGESQSSFPLSELGAKLRTRAAGGAATPHGGISFAKGKLPVEYAGFRKNDHVRRSARLLKKRGVSSQQESPSKREVRERALVSSGGALKTVEKTAQPGLIELEQKVSKKELSQTVENALRAAVDRSGRAAARKKQDGLLGGAEEGDEKSGGQYTKDNLGRTYLVINSREFIRLEHLGLNAIEKNMERIEKITKYSARFIKQ